jgi:hypothetical protein
MANPRPAGDRDLIARDRDHVFHPYTSTEQQRAVLPVAG